MIIQPIVEGHGEVSAVPELLRRLAYAGGIYDIRVLEPIRRKFSELTTESNLKKAVQLARRFSTEGIIVIFDSDDFCPKENAPRFSRWAKAAARGTPCEVTVAHREYEAWFLASVESLRGKCNVRLDASYGTDPEAPRDAKGRLEGLMDPPHYDETRHQIRMTAQFEMAAAYTKSRSFRHLTTSFGRLLNAEARYAQWPPKST